jgi:hypothetical protein
MTRAVGAVTRDFVLHENGARLVPDHAAMRISLPSEEAFGSYEQARAHIADPPLPPTTNVFWNQGYFDVHLRYPIASADSDFALDMRFGGGLGDRVKLIVDFLPADGGARTYQVHGGHGWLDLDPGWFAAAWTFTQLGFDHILDGIDHLLFLLCLVLPFGLRQFWTLVGIITSFTVAHSITLIAAATGFVPSGNCLRASSTSRARSPRLTSAAQGRSGSRPSNRTARSLTSCRRPKASRPSGVQPAASARAVLLKVRCALLRV